MEFTEQQTTEKMSAAKMNETAQTPNEEELLGESDSVFVSLKGFAAVSCRDALIAAIVFFYSSNSISTAIRMALGSSV